MTVEIISASIKESVVIIECTDCSEANLERMERTRMDDGHEKTINIVIDTTEKKSFLALRRWMLQQKCTNNKKTWGDALASLKGTITDTYGIGKFRVWDM